MKLMKLSGPMTRVMDNLEAGRYSDWGLYGRSQYGGHDQVILALVRRGLIYKDGELIKQGRWWLDRRREERERAERGEAIQRLAGEKGEQHGYNNDGRG